MVWDGLDVVWGVSTDPHSSNVDASSIFVYHTVGKKLGTLGDTQLLEQLETLETRITKCNRIHKDTVW